MEAREPLTEHEADAYLRVEDDAIDPPGGIPDGWHFHQLNVHAHYDPHENDTSELWKAAAEYKRTDRKNGTRRLVGSGPTLLDALDALHARIHDPLSERYRHSKGGWDTQWKPGRPKE
jgi:hypothetical protein